MLVLDKTNPLDISLGELYLQDSIHLDGIAVEYANPLDKPKLLDNVTANWMCCRNILLYRVDYCY